MAAAQTEGAATEDGRGPSIWDHFAARRGKIYQNHQPDPACSFYHLYREDIAAMKGLGIPNFRFSLSWSRILPDGMQVNQKGLDFYKRLTDHLLGAGIQPWITLYHWDLPQELEKKGGWVSRDILHHFERFALTAARELGPLGVQDWMVLNEPLVFTGAGYFLGYHAPGRKGMVNFLPAMLHAALCTRVGEEVLHHIRPDARVGSTYSCSWITPAGDSERTQAAARKTDALLNRLFVEPALGMGFPLKDLPALSGVEKWMRPEDEKNLSARLDFIGVQNYTREVAESAWYVPYLGARLVPARKRGVPVTEMGWEVSSESLYRMLMQFHNLAPHLPLIVTESGAAFPDPPPDRNAVVSDPLRKAFLQNYIDQTAQAIARGVPVKGYFVWTLMDNFEWAEGFRPRFGLLYTDFETLRRIPKESGLWFGRFIQGMGMETETAGP